MNLGSGETQFHPWHQVIKILYIHIFTCVYNTTHDYLIYNNVNILYIDTVYT